MTVINKLYPLLGLLIMASTTAISAEQPESLKAGEKSFKEGDYERSLKHFNDSLSQGIKSPVLYYNLGSTHYKLGNYETSRKYFLKLTSNKRFSPLANYNLGLIAHKQNKDSAAIEYFTTSRRLSQNESLKKLNSKQISRLAGKNNDRWGGYVFAGFGHDSNITSAPQDVATNESGNFYRALANVSYVISGTNTKGLVTAAGFYANDYINTSFNDDKLFSIDLSLRDMARKWRLSYDASIKQSTYGDDDYQRIYQASFSASNKLSKNTRLRLRYRYEDLNSLTARFDYLDGSRQKIRSEYSVKQANERFRFQYELELNDRRNTATRNYSPTRHKFAIKYDNKLTALHSIGGELEFRTSNYDATATQDRADDRWGYAARYNYRLDKHWKLRAQLKHKDNDSNEPGDIFDYEKTITSIDISRAF